jgi:formate/nitrite transporter FocA (FNT family)
MAVKGTRVAGIAETAKTMCQTKLNDNLFSLFLLGIFCGMLMFIAVDGYAKTKNPIILFLGVGTFILCGFEHCIADMFYFSIAGMWSPLAFVDILMITLGNSIGGMLIPAIKKIG